MVLNSQLSNFDKYSRSLETKLFQFYHSCNAFNQAYQNGARFFPFVDSFKFPFQAFCINQERRGAIQNKSMGNLNRIQKLAPFEKENPTSSTLHILKLSSRCPTMDSLVKFDDMIEIFYEFDKRYIMIIQFQSLLNNIFCLLHFPILVAKLLPNAK